MRLGVRQVRDVDELRRGLGQDLRERRVAEDVDGDAAAEVEILLALGIPHAGALPADKHQRVPAIRRHHILVKQGNDFFGLGHKPPF